MNPSKMIRIARWDCYRNRMHHGSRLRAFERDVAKAVKTWEWGCKPYRGFSILILKVGRESYAISIEPPSPDQIAIEVERLTLEALRDVAKATKERLDAKR